MARAAAPPPPLVAAAAALEDELDRYVQLTGEVRRITINSEKTLARASRAVQEAAACHERILDRVGALSAAMVQTRERQEACLGQMAEAARHVSDRATAFQALLSRYADLGREAKAVNELAGGTAALRASSADPQGVTRSMAELAGRIERVVDQAAALVEAARGAGFDDLGRSVDGLRQQMLAANNKLSLARTARGDHGPS